MRNHGPPLLLRTWFMMTCCVIVIMLTSPRMSAQTMTATALPPGVDINGAVDYPAGSAAPSPISIDRDDDIEQPKWYVPHDPPPDEAETEDDSPDTLEPEPEVETPPMEGEALEPIFPETPIYDPYEWSWPEVVEYEDRDIAPVWDQPPPLGYSSEIEYISNISNKVDMIFTCMTLIIAAVIVYIIIKAVWPLFRPW